MEGKGCLVRGAPTVTMTTEVGADTDPGLHETSRNHDVAFEGQKRRFSPVGTKLHFH